MKYGSDKQYVRKWMKSSDGYCLVKDLKKTGFNFETFKYRYQIVFNNNFTHYWRFHMNQPTMNLDE